MEKNTSMIREAQSTKKKELMCLSSSIIFLTTGYAACKKILLNRLILHTGSTVVFF